MRIISVTTAVVEANYDWTFVRIETDTGVVGVGECFFAPGLTAMIRDLRGAILGLDPRDIDALVRRLRRAASGAGSVSGIVHNAITGIEAALLDLVGRHFGVPIWQLLGGRHRHSVRVYADCHAGSGLESWGPALNARQPEWFREAAQTGAASDEGDALNPAAWATRARQAVATGFDALKFDLDCESIPSHGQIRPLGNDEMDRMVARVAAVRAEVGPAVDLALDCHWRYSLPDITRLGHRLAEFGLMWLEDPLPPENPRSFRTLRESVPVPLGTGENLFLWHGFRELIETQSVHIVCPDLQKVGGLLEGRRIADHAALYDLMVAPHCIAGPIGTLASAHLCAAIPNLVALEFHGQDVPFWNDLLSGWDGPLIVNGSIQIPDGPGLGATLNEGVARRYARAGEPFFVE